MSTSNASTINEWDMETKHFGDDYKKDEWQRLLCTRGMEGLCHVNREITKTTLSWENRTFRCSAQWATEMVAYPSAAIGKETAEQKAVTEAVLPAMGYKAAVVVDFESAVRLARGLSDVSPPTKTVTRKHGHLCTATEGQVLGRSAPTGAAAHGRC